MDDFRGLRRPVQPSYTRRALPGDVSPKQTPLEIASSGAAAEPSLPASGVNPTLSGAISPLQSVSPQLAPQPRHDMNRVLGTAPASPIDLRAALTPDAPAQPLATAAQPLSDFSVPRPAVIGQQLQNMSAAAEHMELSDEPATANYLQDAAAAPPSPFDIATIQESDKPRNRLSAGRAWRKWLLHGGLAMLVLLTLTGGYLFWRGLDSAHKVFRGTAVKSTSDAQSLLKGESSGHVNILLLGNGGDGHEAPDLTDTMMVESIDTVNKKVTLLSIPRDLWVQVPGAGSTKINAAYEIGKYDKLGKIDDSNADTDAVFAGFKSADQAVKTVTGLDINYNVLVNFHSFKQAVDAVGGIDINVPTQLYDPTMAWENHGNPVLAQPGEQTMDGSKALMYVRSRETSSDFARGERQRAVIMALKNKLLTAGTLGNPLKLSSLLSAFGDNMVSDFSLSDAMRAYSIGKDVSDSNTKSADLVTQPHALVTTGTVQGASIDLPKAGMYDYDAIKAYVQQLINPQAATSTAASVPETATITVLNGTTTAGLAAKVAANLSAAGYTVGTVGNAPGQSYPKTVVVDLSNGADPNTKAYLEKTYGASAVTTLPDSAISAGSANFIVILGSDQAL